jgi:hypothetical protein
MTPLEKDSVRAIAEEVSQKTVNKTFLALGVDSSDNKGVLDFQKDLAHLRRWRESTEEIQQKGLMTVVTVILTGALGWLAYVIFGGHHP